jgi:hypothetical protein
LRPAKRKSVMLLHGGMGSQIRLTRPAQRALFYWWLGVEVSFLPTMKNHHVDGNTATRGWEGTTRQKANNWRHALCDQLRGNQ